jgi:uncharacterized protein (TIGR00296 family)
MNQYISLAKLAVETYVKEGRVLKNSPKSLAKDFLERRAGVFVSIFRSPHRTDAEQKRRTDAEKELRGCVGTYLPTEDNIAREIIQSAVAVASQDYRFGPIQKDELSHLSYTVYILGKPELISGLDALDPKIYGVIVKSLDFPRKTGLLLPDLDGVNTSQEQISIACQKAGINTSQESTAVYRFKVEKYE